MLVDGFEHFEELESIHLIYFKHNCSENSQAVHMKENGINETEYSVSRAFFEYMCNNNMVHKHFLNKSNIECLLYSDYEHMHHHLHHNI